MNLVKVPSPMRLLCGGALAYWLSHIINPAFVAIAVMIVLFIPIFVSDYYSAQLTESIISKPVSQPIRLTHQPIVNPTIKGSTNKFISANEALIHKAILTK
jgi:hypothetical protein